MPFVSSMIMSYAQNSPLNQTRNFLKPRVLKSGVLKPRVLKPMFSNHVFSLRGYSFHPCSFENFSTMKFEISILRARLGGEFTRLMSSSITATPFMGVLEAFLNSFHGRSCTRTLT